MTDKQVGQYVAWTCPECGRPGVDHSDGGDCPVPDSAMGLSGVPFVERDAQGQADMLYGLLLIGAAVDGGWLDDSGPFHVETDRVYASLALLAADDAVSEPDREVAVREAIRLMGFRDGLPEEDYEVMTVLLRRVDVEYPGNALSRGRRS